MSSHRASLPDDPAVAVSDEFREGLALRVEDVDQRDSLVRGRADELRTGPGQLTGPAS
ncbi:hypothetical protein ACWCXE_05520 [Streptomyces sp. NPDC001780]